MKRLRLLGGIVFVVSLLCTVGIVFGTQKAEAAPATFTVTNTNDSGAGSLRQAIEDANNNNNPSDMDFIDFNIAGGGVKVISPESELPFITQKVYIDASTQPGADCSPRSIVIRLDGTLAGNSNGLVLWNSESSGSVIKGISITNFTWMGIRMVNVSDADIVCNNVGVEEDGFTPGPNNEDGITIFEESSNNIIGGSSAADRNILSGNTYHGISLVGNGNTSSTVIIGNYIGVDATGTQAVPNGRGGIIISGSTTSTQIGGPSAGERNVISGNSENGIGVYGNAADTTIKGNYIGLNESGDAAIANEKDGVVISDNASASIVGGPSAGERNVISGNSENGIGVYGNAADTTIKGNYIGLNAEGLADVANLMLGINSSPDIASLIIGGVLAGEGNIVSGNGVVGINIEGDNNEIYGNTIGLGADGITPVPNLVGINIIGTNNTVGGYASGKSNTVSGNSALGLLLTGSSNTVIDNYLYDNLAYGIGIFGSDNSIVANTISGGLFGVMVLGITAAHNNPAGNTIYNNSITGATVAGIDLNENTSVGGGYSPDTNIGPTPNDPLDADAGPNDYLNTPIISAASESASTTAVDFNLDVPAGDYRIEFFSNNVADPSGYGQGETPIGFTTITSNGTGEQSFSASMPGTGHTNIAATTTEDYGNDVLGSTSEFSATFSNIAPNTVDDQDSISSETEDAAPGNGDGNNDGTPDSQQSNVTSLPNASGDYVTLAVPEGVTIDTTSIAKASSLSSKDMAYNYPLGLVSFTATTDIGATIPIELYFYTNQQANTFTPRKYNTTNKTYTTLNTLTQTSLTQTTINNQPVLKLSYQLTDGGSLDQDNTVNGTIVDPVGLAQVAIGVPETGLGE